jgi:hypothetical protein
VGAILRGLSGSPIEKLIGFGEQGALRAFPVRPANLRATTRLGTFLLNHKEYSVERGSAEVCKAEAAGP